MRTKPFLQYLVLFFCLAFLTNAQAATMPMTLAGITLGANISTVTHCCQLSTDMQLSDERQLNEIDLQPQFVPGVRSATVAYANCAEKGKIVRIKLKFDDSSREFFNDLFAMYEKKFGRPEEWRGNPFHSVLSWKWSFKDGVQRVGIELTHSDDEDYKTGNFVKLTLRSLWESELMCMKKREQLSQESEAAKKEEKSLDYSLLIPK